MSRITFTYKKVVYTKEPRPRESEETLFNLVWQLHSKVALKGCHNEVGHLGLEHMLDLLHDWFFWPHMAAQTKEHIGKCPPHLTFKAKQPKAPLESIMATLPLEFLHLNYLCLEPSKGLKENVLVVTDYFTRYAQTYVTRTQTAQTPTKTLWNKFTVHYGLTKRILLDQGQNFDSQLVVDLCKLMGTQKIQISLYHPQTVNVTGSTPLWLVYWEWYPQRRNQSGRTILEC